jgi:hypothetical protein
MDLTEFVIFVIVAAGFLATIFIVNREKPKED